MFLSNLKAGDKVLTHYSLYGGTHELLSKVLLEAGIETIVEDLRDLNLLEDVIKKTPAIKLVHVETPANPTLQCVDLKQ
jgi:methionine-gamma-lyase